MADAERRRALESLLRAEVSLDATAKALSAYPWDCEAPLAVLRPHHISSVLDRFLAGQLAEAEVARWAALLEGRDDLELEQRCARDLGSILFQLSSPEINAPITSELARRLNVELERLAA